ncbi:hypothetical protein P5673_020441 [Acropora cervicornis]|uniref:Uncharacterized protein n=1 Tax=Acropora cervicornis TaxID=6130 RepID=A0AAD9Q9X9_ACRCE|nr:hypothetical protein P5673_020441 [Acropora cervicornis]
MFLGETLCLIGLFVHRRRERQRLRQSFMESIIHRNIESSSSEESTAVIQQPSPVLADLAPVVQNVDNAINRINHYPLDIAIGFAITYPVDSDLSGG